MVKSAQVWTGNFVTLDATGALAAASVGPAGVLYVAGVATADVVTISGANPYKFSVTLPVLTAGQSVGMYVTATVGGIATASLVAEDIGDTVILSDVPAVNVTQVKGATIADLDASGNVLAKLAGGVTHGDWSSYLLLKSLDIRNDDVGGIGAYIRSSDAILGGRAVQIDGIGLSKAVEINGIFDADMSGTIDGLSSDAQQDVANALGIAPTSGTPATGSVYDLLADVGSGGLTAQETADAVNNLAPTGTPAVGSIGSHLDAILNGLTGVGLLPLIYTVTVTGTATPIEGVTVEVYTEEACINCIRRGTTNSFGVVTFWLTTTGTYWLRREKDGVTFVNPDSEIVSA